jgi:biopolymer transport protein ExbD
MRRRVQHEEESTGIDLAPMLDFVLNLLIFFIITAVFVRQLGFAVDRAAGSAAAGDASAALAVSLDDEGNVYVDGREVDLRSVRPNVERYRISKPDGGVIVVADDRAASGLLVQVVDQVRLGGVQNIAYANGRTRK